MEFITITDPPIERSVSFSSRRSRGCVFTVQSLGIANSIIAGISHGAHLQLIDDLTTSIHRAIIYTQLRHQWNLPLRHWWWRRSRIDHSQ
jgi:hypothetical protein